MLTPARTISVNRPILVIKLTACACGTSPTTMSLTPFSRSDLQAEADGGHKRQQIRGMITRPYNEIIQAARDGQTTFFFLSPQQIGISVRAGPVTHRSTIEFITHADLIQELQKLFPDVTITSVERKGTAQMVYQQPGILLDWSS